MKTKYKWGHISDYDYSKHRTEYKGATKEQFEKKNTVPDQAVDVKKLVKRIENGRPKPIISE
jgi:hypothetical protein